ncbi:MAG: formylglycine-generating enzyme family protein [Longimicrobiales bacterium]
MPQRWIEPVTQMEFALLPAGAFVAGSPLTEPGHQSDEVLYPVRIASPLYMATREVTRREWAAVMSPGVAVDDAVARLPVVNVNWHEVRQFLDRLNAGYPWRFRLPSETEWEYACRAGTTTPYSTGPFLSTDEANYNGQFPLPGQAEGENRGSVTPVGSFHPNAWGLFDMHGNVWEWTNDAYDESRKVIRGGSWRFNADSARCALRYHHAPRDRGDSLGFRIVRDLTIDEREEKAE